MSLDPDPTTTAADLRWLREREREIRERARRVDWGGTLTAEQIGYHNSLLATADRYARIAEAMRHSEHSTYAELLAERDALRERCEHLVRSTTP